MHATLAARRLLVVAMAFTLLPGSLAACGGPAATPGPSDSPASTAAPLDPATADIGRRFVEALASGDTASAEAMEDETMRGAAPAAALAQLWAQLVAQFGAYQGIGTVATEAQGAYVNATVETFFSGATVPLLVTVDAEGRVAGLHLGEPGPPASGAPTAGPTPVASPAAYVDTSAFTETEVTVGADPWALPGTLSMPRGSGPFPAVVLVAGSGPQDRDETIGPNTPLRDLAWGLASQGIAVLRYEKRTKEHGAAMAGIADAITVREETVDDAVAAVELLRATEGVDPERVVVAGHSLGGYLAPRIAEQAAGSVAGIALLEASISPLEDLIVAQLAYLSSPDGGSDPQAAQMLVGMADKVALVRSPALSPSTPSADLPLGIPAAYWLDLRGYDPGATAAGLGIPVLVVQGGRDYQVPPSEADAWRAALAGSEPAATVTTYPELNHLMMAGEGPSRPAEYVVPGHVDDAVVADMATWVITLP